MPDDVERERFERWARNAVPQFSGAGKHIRDGAWSYNHNIVQLMWQCWNAARTPVSVEEVAYDLAIATGALIVSTDGDQSIRKERLAALNALERVQPVLAGRWHEDDIINSIAESVANGETESQQWQPYPPAHDRHKDKPMKKLLNAILDELCHWGQIGIGALQHTGFLP
jgi:hypothetical protein